MRRLTVTSTLTLCFLIVWAIGASCAATNVALNATVTLHGAPFFENGWGGGLVVSPDTIVDAVFFPRHHQWDQGPGWWDSHDGQERYITIDLEGVFRIESFIVQADDNDAYILYYWDIYENTWKVAWNVPNYDVYPDPLNWGMQTRPNPSDNTERYNLSAPIVTNALKFEGNLNDSDRYFSVSEIQAYGERLVPVDIKPQSCPNPLNVTAKGVLPAAILGTENFDVTQIDFSTVALEGVHPLRWTMEDVATPFEPYIGKEVKCDCTTNGPDGYMDLTLKFDIQEVVAELGDVHDGEVRVLKLTGNLKEEFGGTPIIGEDVVVILKKK